MKLKRSFLDIRKGYLEVLYTDPANGNEFVGEVELGTFTAYMDFDKDEVHTITRWVAYRDPFGPYGIAIVGRMTGYQTRKEALDALDEYMEDFAASRGGKTSE